MEGVKISRMNGRRSTTSRRNGSRRNESRRNGRRCNGSRRNESRMNGRGSIRDWRSSGDKRRRECRI